MTTRVTVYVATEGSYSDYRILGVFAKEDDAAAVGEVEEYELYTAVPERKTVYLVRAFPPEFTGGWEIRVVSPWDYAYEDLGTTRRPRYRRYPNGGFQVSGTSRSLVEKAFADRRAQLIAEAEGIA